MQWRFRHSIATDLFPTKTCGSPSITGDSRPRTPHTSRPRSFSTPRDSPALPPTSRHPDENLPPALAIGDSPPAPTRSRRSLRRHLASGVLPLAWTTFLQLRRDPHPAPTISPGFSIAGLVLGFLCYIRRRGKIQIREAEGSQLLKAKRPGGSWVMAMQIPVLPYYAESSVLPTLTYSRPRYLVVSYLPKTEFDYDKRLFPRLYFFCLAVPSTNNFRRMNWSIRSTVDGSRSDPPGSSASGGTRLVRAIQSFQTKLTTRIKELRKGLAVKVLFFLVGFYCATAFATVIGQTGDWDILSAGLAVVVVEGIGALMYRASFPLLDRMRSFITMFNYWKAGLSLGLFLDAFKYEMDILLGSCNPFNMEIDMFPLFWRVSV